MHHHNYIVLTENIYFYFTLLLLLPLYEKGNLVVTPLQNFKINFKIQISRKL